MMREATINMVDWVRKRWYGTTILACVFCLLIGAGLALIVGRTAPTYWIIYCGNTQGGGECGADFVNAGWVSEGNYTTVPWEAAIERGTSREVSDAMPAGHAAYNEHCGRGNCILAGWSLGNAPILQLADEVGQAPNRVYLFGAPQPSSGIFHHVDLQNPIVEYWINIFGLVTDRGVQPGTQAFYNTRDPFANAAPQCNGPGLFALGADGHYIISVQESQQHVWTGPDGVVMHEAGYVAPPGVPASGSDNPSQPWELCPLNDWHAGGGAAGDPHPQESIPVTPVQTLTIPGG